MSNFIVIWNSRSGRANEFESVRQAFAGRQSRWLDLSETDELDEQLANDLAHDCQTVVAAGGDGTVNATVNALMKLDRVRRPSFGIIPMGTANDFARTLCIPDDFEAAVALLDRPTVGVDVVKITGEKMERYYANIAAGGNCVRVSEAMTDEVKSRWGSLSYVRGAVDVLPDMKAYRVQVKCDEEELVDLDTWAILVANGRTNAGGIKVAPQASPTDGLMDIIIIHEGTAGDMIEIVANNLLGSFLESEQVIFRQARSLQLASDPPMRFTIDGEVIDEEPVKFEVVPAAIAMHGGLDLCKPQD